MMLISLIHRHSRLIWPLLPVSSALLFFGAFMLAWPA